MTLTMSSSTSTSSSRPGTASFSRPSDLYQGFRTERARLRYSIGRGGRDKVGTELLIRNY